MENTLDLVSLYESHYLNPQASTVITEKKEVEDDGEDNTGAPKVPAAKKKKKMSNEEIGATLYDSHDMSSFNSKFKQFMEEFDMGDNAFSDEHDEGDDTFEFEGEEETKDSYTLEELRGMTLGELADLLAGGEEEGEGDEGFDFGGAEDAVPTESFGHEGGGKHLGNTQTRDGKPSKQAPTTRVKGNGDADFSKQKTGFAPEDTEGSEGSYLGNTQTRDGKPSKQAPTTRVKGNGDADFGKQRTGFGKKEGERLF